MKNRLNLFGAVGLATLIGLGCGYLGDSSSSQQANVGVPECDRVLDAIETELNNPDENFVVKAAKATALNRIKDNIRQEIEKNANNKSQLANTCNEFKKQFENYKGTQLPPENAER